MRKTLILSVAACLPVTFSHGAAGMYDQYVFTTTDGGTVLNFYSIGGPSDPDFVFDGAFLGTFNPIAGDILQIGGQQKSFKNNDTDVEAHFVDWVVTPSPASGPVSFDNQVGLPFQWNTGDSGAPSGLNNFGDQQWGGDVQGANPSLVVSGNVLSGLDPGLYALVVRSGIQTNGINEASIVLNDNGGSNFTATFEVIPEPSAALLMLLGVVPLLRRRR